MDSIGNFYWNNRWFKVQIGSNKIKKQKQIRLRRGFDVSDGDEMKHYLLKEICQHISKKYNKDIDTISYETSICERDGLALSSIDVIDIIIDLEEKYNIRYDFKRNIRNVEDLVKIVQEVLASNS